MDLHLFLEFFHLIAVISWMAGLLYLPRLFVYHAQVSPQSEMAKTLSVMEYRLLHFIMNPAMIVTFITGIWLMIEVYDFYIAWWLWFKMFFVLCLAGFQGMTSVWHKSLAAGTNKKSVRFYRIANEFPTLMMLLIVGLVVYGAH